ncbi:hypothetical protein BD309DRAFT_960085 [Dichomitus squalens]|nr:hypothetical protein BD309DRAFT_960085 [Dichomitus squalens]
MNMNALTIDWPQAPIDASFVLAARRAEEDAQAALEAIRAAEAAARRPPTPPERTMTTERSAMSPSEGPTEANITAGTGGTNKSAAKPGVVKKKGTKPKMTAKEKRERGLEIERILAALPLEFRGDDPNLRRYIEQVIEKFLDNPGESFNIVAFVKPPDLNQARVNKCLIALVNRKIVKKDNSTGAVLYYWNGLPS